MNDKKKCNQIARPPFNRMDGRINRLSTQMHRIVSLNKSNCVCVCMWTVFNRTLQSAPCTNREKNTLHHRLNDGMQIGMPRVQVEIYCIALCLSHLSLEFRSHKIKSNARSLLRNGNGKCKCLQICWHCLAVGALSKTKLCICKPRIKYCENIFQTNYKTQSNCVHTLCIPLSIRITYDAMVW